MLKYRYIYVVIRMEKYDANQSTSETVFVCYLIEYDGEQSILKRGWGGGDRMTFMFNHRRVT